ncbi:MAG: LacI family DNA-binding transcriptional regulator [Aggregatilineales bacterium]
MVNKASDKLNMRITLQDVADDAGVSRSTASLVLNNNSRISDPTRERVLNSVKRLGYIYNQKAASLRTQRSNTIGLIITDITNPFYAELIHGIEVELKRNGYIALLGSTADLIENQNDLLRIMQERSVDGIILVPAENTTIDAIEHLKSDVSTVLVSRYLQGVQVDYVGIDNELGARRAMEALIDKGHERIAFIGGAHNSSARQDRLMGYTSILEKYTLPQSEQLIMSTPVTRSGGFKAVQSLLRMENPPTAALCYNDVVAFGVMLGLRQAGLEPGHDFSVVGFDDVEEAALWSPSLTTIAAEPSKMGEEAARLLLHRIQNPDETERQIIMPSTLVLRSSVNIRRTYI